MSLLSIMIALLVAFSAGNPSPSDRNPAKQTIAVIPSAAGGGEGGWPAF